MSLLENPQNVDFPILERFGVILFRRRLLIEKSFAVQALYRGLQTGIRFYNQPCTISIYWYRTSILVKIVRFESGRFCWEIRFLK